MELALEFLLWFSEDMDTEYSVKCVDTTASVEVHYIYHFFCGIDAVQHMRICKMQLLFAYTPNGLCVNPIVT